MSQAEALLNSLSTGIPTHTHPVPDTDTYFIIDPITRAIENTNSKKTVIMQYDHDSERFTFELPRYVDGHDMLLCTSVTVNVDNIETGTMEPRINSDAPDMTDLQEHPNDPEKVISSWLVSRNSTQLPGILSFHIEYKCVDSDGNVVYEWSTDTYDKIEVRARKKNGEAAIIEHTDLLEQWRSQIFGAGDSVMANIEAEGEAQVNAVKEESVAQQEAVELKGAQALDSIPEDYTKLDAMADEAVRSKADAIVCEAAGESISVKDASDNHIRGLKLFGKSSQFTTTGKNLFGGDALADEIKNRGGTKDADNGVVSFFPGDIADRATPIFDKFKENTQYTFALYGHNSVDAGITNLIFKYTDGTVVPLTFNNGVDGNNCPPKEFGYAIATSAPGKTVSGFNFSYNNGVTTLQYDKCGIFEGALTVDEFEPYTGGIPAPNPDYPQEIVSIENPTVNICGKNLVDFACFSGSDNYVALVNVSDLRSVKKGKRYTLSVYLHATAATRAYWNNAARLYGYLEFDVAAGTNRYTYSFTALENGELYEAVSNVVNKYPTSDDIVVTALNAQLEIGDKATEYEPYKGGLLPITTPSILPGIPVSEGGNYTDSDGQQWICDEVDLERGVYVRRVFGETLTFHEEEDTNGIRYRAFLTHNSVSTQNGLVVCDKLQFNPNVNPGTNGIRISTFSTNVAIACYNDEVVDTAYALYPLATPIETPLTAEEITTFKALRTNCPNTTILNDAGAWMSAKYNADTKTYVENPKVLRLVDSSTGAVYELKVVDGILTATPI